MPRSPRTAGSSSSASSPAATSPRQASPSPTSAHTTLTNPHPPPSQFSLAPILYKRLRIEGTTLRSRTLEYQSKLLQEFAAKALDKVFGSCGGDKTGMELVIHKVSPRLSSRIGREARLTGLGSIGQVYPWGEIVHAHEEMEAAKNTVSQAGCPKTGRNSRADLPVLRLLRARSSARSSKRANGSD